MKKTSLPARQTLMYLLIVVAAAVVLAVTAITYNNSFRSQPIYLFLLVIGVALGLIFGLVRGGLGGLVILALWIGLKRTTGTWQDIFLLPNLFELLMVMAAFAIAGFYHDRLRLILDAYYNNVYRLEQLNLEDRRIGLIKASVGKLRLTEEEERAVRYRRPFSLLLIQVQSNTERDLSPDEEVMVMRVVANTLKSTTRRTDIPFLAASDQIAIILPETDLVGGKRVVSNVISRMAGTYFIGDDSLRINLDECIRLAYGFAAFTGFSREKINLLDAANRSLEHNLSAVSSPEFQIPIQEWCLIGDESTFTPAASQSTASVPPQKD